MKGAALRRALHASTGAVVLLAPPLGGAFPVLLTVGAVVACLLELARLKLPRFGAFLVRLVPVYRDREIKRPSGAVYLIIGYAAAAWFPAPAALSGILVGALADPAGSLIGRTARAAPGSKTWRGTLAVFATALLVLLLAGIDPVPAVVAAAAAALLERLPAPLDDNLVLSPGTALAVLLLA